jgi:triacylglycerol lipase
MCSHNKTNNANHSKELCMKRLILMISLAVSGLAGSLDASAATTTYAKTKYPVVLVHGLFGFSQIGGSVDYFYQVPADLAANGATVYAPAVNPVASNEARGEQLLAAVKTILAVSGAAKVNLIGHSQGGPTARYVAGVLPGSVASVTTIGGVHKGAPLADLIVGVDSLGALPAGVANGLVNAVGSLIGLASGTSFTPDALAAMSSLSTPGSLAFNQKFPNGVPTSACGNGAASANGQLYYSWTGSSGGGTNILDPLDALMVLAEAAFIVAPGPNDALVGVCSTHFGTVLRDNYPWNHLDEVNQTLGLMGMAVASPVQVIRDHVNRLKLAGV